MLLVPERVRRQLASGARGGGVRRRMASHGAVPLHSLAPTFHLFPRSAHCADQKSTISMAALLGAAVCGCARAELAAAAAGFFDVPRPGDSLRFEDWHSSAMPKTHGQFGVPCKVALAGIIPAPDGEWILDEEGVNRASTCGENLADHSGRCKVFRPAPGSAMHSQRDSREKSLWLSDVQRTRAGIRPFTIENHLTMTRELLDDSKCFPDTFGSELPVVIGGRTVLLRASFGGQGLCGSVAGVASSFEMRIDLPQRTAAPGVPLSLVTEARLVGPSIVPTRVAFRHVGCGGSSGTASTSHDGTSLGWSRVVTAAAAAADAWNFLRGTPRCVPHLVATFNYTVVDGGAYLLEVLVLHLLGSSMRHLAFRGGVRVRPALADTGLDRQTTGPFIGTADRPSAGPPHLESSKPLCVHGDEPGRWIRFSHSGVGGDGVDKAALVNDVLGFNRNYWWEPFACRYQPFSAHQATTCLARNGWSRLGFSGDSLGREPMANIIQILQANQSMLLDGRKYKVAQSTTSSTRAH